MSTIAPASLFSPAALQPTNHPPRVEDQTETPVPALEITVTPSTNNARSGDRSRNSVDVVVETANVELEATVSREDASAVVQRRLALNALNPLQLSDGPEPLISAAAAAALKSEEGELRETAVDVFATKQTLNTAQFALSVVGGAEAPETSNSRSELVPSTNSVSSAAEMANQASQAVVKRTLFFSAVEHVGQKLDEMV